MRAFCLAALLLTACGGSRVGQNPPDVDGGWATDAGQPDAGIRPQDVVGTYRLKSRPAQIDLACDGGQSSFEGFDSFTVYVAPDGGFELSDWSTVPATLAPDGTLSTPEYREAGTNGGAYVTLSGRFSLDPPPVTFNGMKSARTNDGCTGSRSLIYQKE